MTDKLNPAILASNLLRAQDYRSAIPALSENYPDATAEDAYVVQVTAMADRISRNDPIIGARVGVHDRRPVFSLYPRSALMGTFEVADLSQMIQPIVQPVLTLRLFKELAGPGVTEEMVREATETVVGAIEIIDHRMVTPDGLQHIDVVADNGGISKILIGEHGLDISHDGDQLRNLKVRFNVDGEETGPPVGEITSPLSAVAALANHLGEQGGRLEADWFVVVGPLCAPAPLTVAAKVQLEIDDMAAVRLRAR